MNSNSCDIVVMCHQPLNSYIINSLSLLPFMGQKNEYWPNCTVAGVIAGVAHSIHGQIQKRGLGGREGVGYGEGL